MKSFVVVLKAKAEHLSTVVAELAYFQREGRCDFGNCYFCWTQDVADPCTFRLFERWDGQASLDAHLTPTLLARWDKLQPFLAEAPVGQEVRSVDELLAPGRVSEVQELASSWFDKLSNRVPVDELLAFLDVKQLWMRFPPAEPLQSEAQFRSWYVSIGDAFRNQTHEVEAVSVHPCPAGAHVDVQVVWGAEEIASGRPLRARAKQTWELCRDLRSARLLFRKYDVQSLEAL